MKFIKLQPGKGYEQINPYSFGFVNMNKDITIFVRVKEYIYFRSISRTYWYSYHFKSESVTMEFSSHFSFKHLYIEDIFNDADNTPEFRKEIIYNMNMLLTNSGDEFRAENEED